MEEEKIEYLEKRIKNSRRIFEEVGTYTFLDEEIMTIIEELIEGYKTYRGQLNGAFDRGFIPISVIQNKIDEIETSMNKARPFDLSYIEYCEDRIEVLQELIEEGGSKC